MGPVNARSPSVGYTGRIMADNQRNPNTIGTRSRFADESEADRIERLAKAVAMQQALLVQLRQSGSGEEAPRRPARPLKLP